MGRHVGDAQLFPLGSTWYAGDTDRIPAAADYGNLDIEGASRTFRREDYPNVSAAIPGGGDLVAKCVRNVHSAALARSTLVKYKADANGYDRQVIPAGAGEECVGVVDPWLAQTVAVGDLFWIIQEGIVPVLFDAQITTPIGKAVVTAAGGEGADGSATATTTAGAIASIIGVIAQVPTVEADDYGDVLLDIRFG